MTKEEFRSMARAERARHTKEELAAMSAAALTRLYATEAWKSAASVWTYVSVKDEVDTRSLIARALAEGKRVAVPRVTGTSLVFYEFTAFEALQEGYHQLPEPPADGRRAFDPEALVILPGLAFSEEMDRIGYGGGFYDRFLAAHGTMKTAAPAYDFSVFPTLPAEKTDHKTDLIVTDRRMIRSAPEQGGII